MPKQIHYGSIPAFLSALHKLVEEGLEISVWEDKPNMLQGFENAEERITIALSTIRAQYRLQDGSLEPYEAGIQRYKDDIARVLRSGSGPIPFEVGRKAVARGPVHHGTVIEVTEHDVTIRHDDDCCEPGMMSTLSLDVIHRHWRQIIVRRSAWERLLDDD